MVKRPVKTAKANEALEPSLVKGYQNACLGRPVKVNMFGGLLDYLDKRRPKGSTLFDLKKPGLVYVDGRTVADRTNFGFVSNRERRRGPKRNVEAVATKICRLLAASSAPTDLVLTPNIPVLVPVVSIDLVLDDDQFEIQAVVRDQEAYGDLSAGLTNECLRSVRILSAPKTPDFAIANVGLPTIVLARGNVPSSQILSLGEAFSQAPKEVKPHELALDGIGYVHSQSGE